MSTVEKLVTGIVAIGMATTLTLKDRQTAKVGSTLFSGVRGLLATAMGTGKRV